MSFAIYLKNIEEKTGLSPSQFEELAKQEGYVENGKIKKGIKATEVINWLKESHGLGHGHAQAVHAYINGKRS